MSNHIAMMAALDDLVQFFDEDEQLLAPDVRSRLLPIVERARQQLAVVGAADKQPRYTSVSKGGSYVKLGVIRGAGSLKGLSGIAYQDEKGGLFIREPECFAKRMVLVEQAAPAAMQSPSLYAQAVGRIKREGGDA